MCDLFGGGSKASTSTTPTYVPPAQTVTSGPASPGGVTAALKGAIQPGVSVKGQNTRARVASSRARGRGTTPTVDTTTSARRRKSASAGLGL